MSWGFLERRPRLPPDPTPYGTTKPFEHQFTRAAGARDAPPPCDCTPRTQWMSEDYLQLIDKCAALCLQPDHKRNVACTLTKDVWRLLTMEYQPQVDAVAEDIEACLKTKQGTYLYLQGYYTILNRWYCH